MHLVVVPGSDDARRRAIGEAHRRYTPAEPMRWIGATYVRRHLRRHPRCGGKHLYQGRFKRLPVQDDYHFLAVCRYVEANAVRARLVSRAEQWHWCGLWRRQQRKTDLPLADWPEDRPRKRPVGIEKCAMSRMPQKITGRREWALPARS